MNYLDIKDQIIIFAVRLFDYRVVLHQFQKVSSIQSRLFVEQHVSIISLSFFITPTYRYKNESQSIRKKR